ncbi:MAG: hybrid sensor histidine kinase/response regulator [Spirochaetales bacterium]|nr:hybrid sensor histidine kinase/response regulator [Spirochaetales bacterium]
MEQKILIVDDTAENRKLLTSLIREHTPYKIVVSKGGTHLIDKLDEIKSNPPDLILLDILMPDVNGYEISKILKEDSKTKDIPIIFLTALNDIESKQKAFEAGGVDYLSKPFNRYELLSRIKVHLELRASQEQLVQSSKMEALGKLTSGLAHELKNPLNFIYNFSQLNLQSIEEIQKILSEQSSWKSSEAYNEISELISDLEDNAKEINENSKRINSLLESMLNTGRDIYSIESETDINSILKESFLFSFNYFNVKHPDLEIELTEKYDTNLPKLNIPKGDISRVFINLINNAFYMLNQKAQTSKDYKPQISLTSARDENNVLIQIKDNGPGIKAEDQSKIFDPFFTTKPPGEGTGLGLKLCYEIIVEQLGGEISFTTEEGEFTSFLIKLPLSSI